MLTPFGYFDLIDEMANTGCPICNLLTRDVKSLLNTMLYEYVTEPEMHEIFRASHGLCNVHGWQLSELGNVMSIGILYRAVLDEILKGLEQVAPKGNYQPKSVRRLFNKKQNADLVDKLTTDLPCPACQKNDENEARYIIVFSDFLTDERLVTAYRDSDGLCLGHFKQVLQRTSNQENSKLLVEIQRAIWMRLRQDVAEFVRKYDYNNADEAVSSAEGDSWLRVIRQLTGEKGMFGLRSSSKTGNDQD